jgi:hypothetical protein
MINQCSAMVACDGGWHWRHCSNKAMVQSQDGKWWCKTHNPDAVKSRNEAKTQLYNMELVVRKIKDEIRNAKDEIIDLIMVTAIELPQELQDLKQRIATLRIYCNNKVNETKAFAAANKLKADI